MNSFLVCNYRANGDFPTTHKKNYYLSSLRCSFVSWLNHRALYSRLNCHDLLKRKVTIFNNLTENVL